MVAISSRSALDSERVERPRMVWTNLPSAAAAAGSALGPADRPRVSGFFSGVSAFRICCSVTVSSPARAVAAANVNAAPIVTAERIAVSFCFAKMSNIASPSCAVHAAPNQFANTAAGHPFPAHTIRLVWATGLRVRRQRRRRGPESSLHPVIGEFLDNVRIHRLGIGDVQLALRNRTVALLGKATAIERGGQSRVDLQGGVKIGN